MPEWADGAVAGKDSFITSWAQPEPFPWFRFDEKKLKKYQKNRFLDILDPAGLRGTVEKFLKHSKSLVTPGNTVSPTLRRR